MEENGKKENTTTLFSKPDINLHSGLNLIRLIDLYLNRHLAEQKWFSCLVYL